MWLSHAKSQRAKKGSRRVRELGGYELLSTNGR